MKIVHIITGLGNGGAEHTLFKICKHDRLNEHIVISLKQTGKYFSLLKNLGIKVYSLDLNYLSFYKFIYLIKLLRILKPDIAQTWLVHADLIGGIASRIAGVKNIIWNIRYSNFDNIRNEFTKIYILKILAKLSYFIPSLIITVSKRAKKIYKNKGYDSSKLKFIPNGYDIVTLRPSLKKKKNFKKKIRKKKNLPLIGFVARYDPKKDHLNLLKALSIIRSKDIHFYCILVGNKINRNNKGLNNEIKKLSLNNQIKLLGQSSNILEIMNGLDVHVSSSSYGEGFPNVIAEAMICGTPCVATDVGDTSFIIGNTGWVVPPNNPTKLAKAIEKALNDLKTSNWKKRCVKASLRIKDNFDIKRMIRSYNEAWLKIYKEN